MLQVETRCGSAATVRGREIAPCLYFRKIMTKQRVIAYIDGFNLFYSCLKGTSYKWLDLEKFCKFYPKPNLELVTVKYFSAPVNSAFFIQKTLDSHL